MNRKIELEASKIMNRDDAHEYLQQIFVFEDPARNLDALYDNLVEVEDEIELSIDSDNIHLICQNAYAYRVLMVIGRAVNDNPNIKLIFKEL